MLTTLKAFWASIRGRHWRDAYAVPCQDCGCYLTMDRRFAIMAGDPYCMACYGRRTQGGRA